MNSLVYLFCVRCKKNARFLCERCSDPYCTKTCQVIHWPYHRKICFPMPSLLEIPTEQNMISICDTRISDSLALTYHSNSQNPYRSTPTGNYSRRNNNCQRPMGSESFTHQQQLCEWGDIQAIDFGHTRSIESKKHDSVMKTQRCQLSDLQKCNKPIRTQQEAEQSMLSDTRNDSDAIVNLSATKESEKRIPLTESKTQNLMQKESLNWNEEKNDPINELSDESENWRKPFPLANDTFVTIAYFADSPTMSCWVVQSQHAFKRKNLEGELKRLHSSTSTEAAENRKIFTKELYCVEYDDKCYRGVCLYQIHSKAALFRLIDVGVTFQTQTSAINCLDPRLKTINAFAFEINFEKALCLTIGQKLCISSFSVDETGTMNVKLRQDEQNTQIETVPLPLGVPLELFCLDYSNIEKGYISACVHDPKKIDAINRLSDKIKGHLKKIAGRAGKYSPKLDEVCFAYHDSEHQWYRAECINEISSDSFEVIFIDYGSTRIVNSLNMRKLVSEFTEPAIMHYCCIQGMLRQPTNELIKKIVTFFNEKPIFSIANAKYEDGMIFIDCPELTKAMQ